MQYFGGKYRVAKDISNIINNIIDDKDYVEPFCGACNVMSNIITSGNKYAYDKHLYLIEMWKQIQSGWIPPTNITEQDYYFYKEHKDEYPHIAGFVGFACSFSGKWFGGYARNSRGDNFAKNGSNSLIKQRNRILDIFFKQSDYKDLCFKNKFIYCDPPYKNTTQYNGCTFDYEEYLLWVKKQSGNNIVLCSEYDINIPIGANVIWEKKSKKEIRNKSNNREGTTEVLWTYNNI